MGVPFFPQPPPASALSPFQRNTLVRFRRLLEACQPVHTEAALTTAELDEGGFLRLTVKHRVEDFQVALHTDEVQIVTAWGDVEGSDVTFAEYPAEEATLKDALNFARHILLGRFETETTYVDDEPRMVATYLIDKAGNRHRIGVTGKAPAMLARGDRRVEVRRISFVD